MSGGRLLFFDVSGKTQVLTDLSRAATEETRPRRRKGLELLQRFRLFSYRIEPVAGRCRETLVMDANGRG
jgi:hypothetical protein